MLLLEERDHIDFDARFFWQPGGLNGGPSRLRATRIAEERGVLLVHGREVREVGKIYRGPDHLLEGSSCGFQNLADVLEGTPCLIGDRAAYEIAGRRVNRYLTRYEQK